jgi:UDP-N-acetylglucosamine 2-epimerase (non-hydrolysing)
MVAVKLGVRLVHVEAGLRSFDRTMPEEINRVLTDAISDLLFCSEPSGVANLRNEGVADGKVFFVGNVMIDTLMRNKHKSQDSRILEDLTLSEGGYAVLTLHRPGNVDDIAVLGRILDAVQVIQEDLPVVFPAHPRTVGNLTRPSLSERVEGMSNLQLTEAAGYLDFLKLMSSARIVLTDSGGVQEETTILNVPCLTLRNNTERPVTTQMGTNRVVGTDPENIIAAYRDVRSGRTRPGKTPPLWDGKAARRIVKILLERL